MSLKRRWFFGKNVRAFRKIIHNNTFSFGYVLSLNYIFKCNPTRGRIFSKASETACINVKQVYIIVNGV